MTDTGLSQQQIAVIAALSIGATITAAAEQAGVHRNTIANWRRNNLPFQHALAHAQYDRAMLFREKTEALVELAFKTLQEILADPKAPASTRLKAALAVIQTASTPPEPKKQVMLDIEKIHVVKNTEPPVVHQDPNGNFEHKVALTPTPTSKPNTPQTIRHETPKIGRNETCPCGSSLKFKRCCLGKSTAQAA